MTKRPVKNLYLITRELERQCMELNRTGLSYREIGEKLGVHPKKVATTLRKAYAKADDWGESNVVVQRNACISRIDEMINAVYEQAIGSAARVMTDTMGNETLVKLPSAELIRTVDMLDKRRADLLGLNAPKRIEADVRSTHAIDEKLEELLNKARPDIPKSVGSSSTVRVVESQIIEDECR